MNSRNEKKGIHVINDYATSEIDYEIKDLDNKIRSGIDLDTGLFTRWSSKDLINQNKNFNKTQDARKRLQKKLEQRKSLGNC
jgi:hypothetical protein